MPVLPPSRLPRLASSSSSPASSDAGLDIGAEVKSKRDLAKVQDQFNAWAKETGLPYLHISRICAMSIGENYEASRLMRAIGGDEE